ncbi:MAG: restriction endonuclease subunit R [Leptolyngbyaceae cyanobacterium MO_188.B28]|nr:restriction endonuclease subunit R [Leptolyngbyaceae cyanobacterium MO_188.B28]
MTVLRTRDLSLREVHDLFRFQRQYSNSFLPLLNFEDVTLAEQQELIQIQTYFDYYLTEGETSEGQVKLVAISPLLKLAGYYQPPIQIKVEDAIAKIDIKDDDTTITGRLDLLAINRSKPIGTHTFLWILLIETKKGLADPLAGLPQLLTYAHKGLANQKPVWGLTTNGVRYQFVYIQAGDSPIYQLMPTLNLFESEDAAQLLQVLKSILQGSI